MNNVALIKVFTCIECLYCSDGYGLCEPFCRNPKMKAENRRFVSNSAIPLCCPEIHLLPDQGRKILIMPIGLARSGKSTWAKTQNYPVISVDAVRLALHGTRYDSEREDEVWRLMYLLVDALFIAGNDVVILDATSLNKESRDKWRGRGYELKFKIFDTSPEICKERAMLTNQEDLIPVIDAMVEKRNYDEITESDLWDPADVAILEKFRAICEERQKTSGKHE